MTRPIVVVEIERLNEAPAPEFVATLGAIYEHSPWVAELASSRRPFASLRALHDAMVECVTKADRQQQLALIKAHPELAGAEAKAGSLTEASTSEQGRLGLTRLDRATLDQLADLNRHYREAFGFPCIIALRKHQSAGSVLAAFERRLANTREQEIDTALAEIGDITRGRLARMFGVEGGRLSTHVLDTEAGLSAGGMAYDLFVRDGEGWRHVTTGATNTQGRTDHPLVSDIDLAPARYRLQFQVGDYYRRRGAAVAEPAFLDVVPIEFGVADPARHYHVPLLCTQWSYSTYRGS